MNRTQTKQIHVGPVAIGGGAPVAVQSMCNTHTSDARATIEQIARLHDAGCEIIRLAVPDQAAADALPEIVHASPIPVVADIHFDYRLALAREHDAAVADHVFEQQIAEFLAWLNDFSEREHIQFTLSLSMDPATTGSEITKYMI